MANSSTEQAFQWLSDTAEAVDSTGKVGAAGNAATIAKTAPPAGGQAVQFLSDTAETVDSTGKVGAAGNAAKTAKTATEASAYSQLGKFGKGCHELGLAISVYSLYSNAKQFAELYNADHRVGLEIVQGIRSTVGELSDQLNSSPQWAFLKQMHIICIQSKGRRGLSLETSWQSQHSITWLTLSWPPCAVASIIRFPVTYWPPYRPHTNHIPQTNSCSLFAPNVISYDACKGIQ